MEIKIIAISFIKNNVRRIFAQVNEDRAKKVIAKLKSVNAQIVKKLRTLLEKGEIGTIFKPVNPEMQDYLDDLILAKKQIKSSINKISEIFLR